MPESMLDKLPSDAKKIYESAWEEGKSKGWDDERCAKYAIGAVKQAGFRKGVGEKWTKMTEPVTYLFGDTPSTDEWIEVACTGSVIDMNGHKVSISDDDLDAWINAYNEGVRGQDIPITYDHPRTGGIAAGWVRGLKRGPARDIRGQTRQTLVMRPEWTPQGLKSIKDRDYQYTSVEILPDPNALRAVSLVNFPAIKGLKPVTEAMNLGENVFCLEEFMAEKTKEVEKKNLKKCPECGAPVPEDSDACPACGAKIESEEKEVMGETVSKADLENLSEKVSALTEEKNELATLLSELKANLTAESERAAKMAEEREKLEEQVSQLVDLNNMMRLHEKVVDFMSLAEDHTRTIAPAYEESIINLLIMAESTEQEQEILDFLGKLATGEAIVPLGEVGSSAIPPLADRGSDEGRQRLHEKASKMAADQNITYKEALMEVSRREEK